MNYKNSIVKFCIKTLFLSFLSYSCLLHANDNDLEQTSVSQGNNENNITPEKTPVLRNNNENDISLITKDFISGAKEGCIVPLAFFLLLLPVNMCAETFFSGNGLKLNKSSLGALGVKTARNSLFNTTSGYTEGFFTDNGSKYSDIESVRDIIFNPANILLSLIMKPITETITVNCIIQNVFDRLTSVATPERLSNQKVYDKLLELSQKNIPLLNKLFHFLLNKVKKHHTVSENSSSFMQEAISDFLLGSVYLSISSYDTVSRKLVGIYEVMSESDRYRKNGYSSALAYKLGFNFGVYFILLMSFLYVTYPNY